MRIKELPYLDKPREKAITYGIDSLNDAELLAILIGSGTRKKSCLEMGNELIHDYRGLYSLSKAPLVSLSEALGLKQALALRLLACFEIAKRLEREDYQDKLASYSPSYLFERYQPRNDQANREYLLLLLLNRKKEIVKEKLFYLGTECGIYVSIKEIIIEVLINRASNFIIMHNHPSSSPLPSQDDIDSSLELDKASKELGIRMIDHIIMGEKSFYSFRETHLI